MAIYEKSGHGSGVQLTLKEQHVYGASRLGMVATDISMWNNGVLPLCPTQQWNREVGEYRYEITNHLGNVNAVVTDNKQWNTTGSYYEAEIVMKVDYYPPDSNRDGMEMPGRNVTTDDYRFAYNGMEGDNDVRGDGNSYTTEFRQYDPRLGRWLSLDPLMSQFPWMSPFVAFDDNPVLYVDPFGLEAGNGDPPIAMSGERSFNDKAADANEIMLLPENPAEGQVVSFLYNNCDNSTTTSTWTYATTQSGGRWEKGVTKSNGGSWGEGQYVSIEEVNTIKTIQKVPPPSPDQNITVVPTVTVNQAGDNSNGPSNDGDNGGGDSPPPPSNGGGKKPPNGKTPPKDPPGQDPPPPLIVTPPCQDVFIPFENGKDYFSRSNYRRAADLLVQYAGYLGSSRSNQITVIIYTARRPDYTPGAGLFESGRDAKCSNMNGRQLSMARYNEIVKMTQLLDKRVVQGQLGYRATFTENTIGFSIRTSACP